jgi:isochorismate synthase
MRNKDSINRIFDQLIEKNIAFAAWFNPREPHLGFVAGDATDVKLFDRFDQLNGEAGFVFAPFNISSENPVILLRPKVCTDDLTDENKLEINNLKSFKNIRSTEKCKPITHEEYLDLITKTVTDIREEALSKVIISRQIAIKRTKTSLGEMFFDLHDKTPNAFSYLVNLPQGGIWMGATPEILIKSDRDRFETVSLAGTQARKYDGEEYLWSTKDIEEQAFVSRYMLDIFFKFNIHHYKTTGPETLESGKVAHLKTSFFFPKEKVENCLGNFVAELHPTPAVCGLPKDLAGEYIAGHEPYNRRYYSGYLGPWQINGRVSLFVNLRCMEITDDELILYAGGGITARSVPEKEWDETNQKAKTLLSVINLKNQI